MHTVEVEISRHIEMIANGSKLKFKLLPLITVGYNKSIEEDIKPALKRIAELIKDPIETEHILVCGDEAYEYAYHVNDKLIEAILMLDKMIAELTVTIEDIIKSTLPDAEVKLIFT